MKNSDIRVALLISGSGSTAEAVIGACQSGILKGIIPAVVIASRSDAGGIAKAKNLSVPTRVVDKKMFPNSEQFGEAIQKVLQEFSIDLISQNGWLPRTPLSVIYAYKGKIINQHPGPLDPGRIDFGGKGMYGERVTAARLLYVWLAREELWTESTIHQVTENYDEGEIIQVMSFPLPQPSESYTIDSIKKNPQELFETTMMVQKALLPLEHKNVISVLSSFARGSVPHFKRVTPLIRQGNEFLAYKAKELAIQLFSREVKKEEKETFPKEIKQGSDVLIVGSGGREHALGWKLALSPQVGKLFFAPGNAGTQTLGTNVSLEVTDVEELCRFAKEKKIDLTIVGPEDALARGIVDRFQKEGLRIFGPTRAAAKLESSKSWATEFMERHGIPHPTSFIFDDFIKAEKFLDSLHWEHKKMVIKVDGLVLGKGVFLPETKEEAKEIVKRILINREFGDQGKTIVFQERLAGKEVSLLAFCDGANAFPMIPVQDYKRLKDNDVGPNTGGMGSVAPSPSEAEANIAEIMKTIIEPALRGMKQEGNPFIGVLYGGIMLTESGPMVIEYNVRFGDPETQAQMMLLKSDLFSIITKCVEGNLTAYDVVFDSGSAVCVVLASGGYPGKYEKGIPIHGIDSFSQKDMMVFFAGAARTHGELVTSGGRVLSVVAKDESREKAKEKVYRAIGDLGIHFENMQYREDIGRVEKDKARKEEPVAFRIELLSIVPDMRAVVRHRQLTNLGFSNISHVTLSDIYTLDGIRSDEEVRKIAEILANPVTQKFHIRTQKISSPLPSSPFSWAIEIGFLPGVTDNIAQTTKEMIADLLQKSLDTIGNVYTSQVIFLSGDISEKEAQNITQALYNPLIQRAHIKSFEQYKRDGGMDIVIPKVMIQKQPTVSFVNLHISDEELTTLGKSGIPNDDGTRRGPLALDLIYLHAVRDYFDSLGRNPTDLELESIAQTWSEHCKHTIFADPIDDIGEGLYKTFIKRATEEIRKKKGKNDICVSVFSDNSGAIIFDDQYLITDKVETHNSPSALDPFGGSITGIVGVNRDALGFGLGAKPILNRYGFCFADPNDTTELFRDKEKTQPLLSPRRIMDGVVAGVNSGGNCSGIPTPLGFLYFDRRYRGKPLVFVGTVGLIPRQQNGIILWQKKAEPGDYIVMVGGRVGVDGIHGATFSSEALTKGSPAGAVQIGDPITQKKLSDAIVKEARDQGLYHSITDNGAGGLSCSVAEMAKESGGCEVELEKVPLKYPGLEPWQIWISESQERMTVAVPPEKWNEFSDLMRRRGVEATVIGKFTNSGKCIVMYQGMNVMNVDMAFLHDGLPPRPMTSTWEEVVGVDPQFIVPLNMTEIYISMMGRLNIGSFETISMQYDHEVQGGSVVKPLQGKGRVNGDATVIQPILSSSKGVVVSYGLYPTYSDLDPYAMAGASIDTAIRNAIVVGGKRSHLALVDNFCWCSATDPKRLGQLKRAAEALHDYSIAFETPIISGKDSMFNDFKGYDANGNSLKISIPPTLLISSLGVVDDIDHVVTLDVKAPGDLVYILGETHDELGGSEYYSLMSEEENNIFGGKVPGVDAEKKSVLYNAYESCVKDDLIASGIAVGRGGLATALAKTALGGKLGVSIHLTNLPGTATSDDRKLFSESQGRILVTIDPKKKQTFEKKLEGYSCAYLGMVTANPRIEIRGINDTIIVSCSVSDCLKSYKSTFGVINQRKPTVAVVTGYGINCEEETSSAFAIAGASPSIIHINDLIDGQRTLSEFEILAVPGGFSYGDDTGSGNAFAQKMKHHLWEELLSFVHDDHLVIGVCNGFQILVSLGLLPALDGRYGEREVALLHNENATYTVRWVDVAFSSASPWTKGISAMSLPIAHGEGKFYADSQVLSSLRQKKLIAGKYVNGEVCRFQSLPPNPNGSLENIAAITDETGKIFGIMPHPERALFFTRLPHWTALKEQYRRAGKELPKKGPGQQIFDNAVSYFSL